jgi:hypothetical protein
MKGHETMTDATNAINDTIRGVVPSTPNTTNEPNAANTPTLNDEIRRLAGLPTIDMKASNHE